MSAPPPTRRPPPSFAPRFTLSLIYLFGFFFVYCLAMAAPALLDVLEGLPPEIETNEAAQRAAQQAAQRATQQAIQPRLWVAVAASVFSTALGAWWGILPGLRER
jgi:TctA family transporter